MHDIRLIRENPAAFDAGLARRGLEPLSAEILGLDASLRALQTDIQAALARRNEASKLIDPAEFPDDLRGLGSELWTQHICNFSVFQSLLDHWALKQLFPVAPLHRLNEKPTVNAILVDITCDSDGKIASFIDLQDVKDYITLHPLNGKPYYLGIFLTGAIGEK